jgi:hypothetical protein
MESHSGWARRSTGDSRDRSPSELGDIHLVMATWAARVLALLSGPDFDPQSPRSTMSIEENVTVSHGCRKMRSTNPRVDLQGNMSQYTLTFDLNPPLPPTAPHHNWTRRPATNAPMTIDPPCISPILAAAFVLDGELPEAVADGVEDDEGEPEGEVPLVLFPGKLL